MSRFYNIILSLLLVIFGVLFYAFTGSLINLAFVVCAIGSLLAAFDEKIFSKILMIVGAIGSAYCFYQMIMLVIR